VAAEPGESVEASLRTSRIVHAALVGSLLLYAVVVHVVRTTGAAPPPLHEPTLGRLRPALYGLGAGVALTLVILRSRWLPAGHAAPTLAALQTRLVVLLALAEVVAVFGLVLFLLGGVIRDFYVLWLPAIGLQLLLTPTREVWEAVARGGGPRSG
jgi:F0F1-type ATP synthase membrane subunit c/vacuolar-type H+-ATPase subunit K